MSLQVADVTSNKLSNRLHIIMIERREKLFVATSESVVFIHDG